MTNNTEFKNELKDIKLDLSNNIDIKDEIEIEDLRSLSANDSSEDIIENSDNDNQSLIVTNTSLVKSENELNSYLQEVRKYPSLSPEEEHKLAVDWAEKKDVNAAHKLVTSHLKLVTKIAMNFRGYGLPMMDVISEGNVGLMQAVKKFDHKRGFRLSTYAMWWIKASIQEYILKSWSLVKIGTTAAQKKLFFNLRKLKNKIGIFANKSLTDEEVKKIASDLDVSEKEVIDMNSRLYNNDSSLNDLINDNEGNSTEVIDLLADESQNFDDMLIHNEDNNIKQQYLYEAIEILNERQKEILMTRRLNDNPQTLQDLSANYGISAERVRQIEEAAIKKISKFIHEKMSAE